MHLKSGTSTGATGGHVSVLSGTGTATTSGKILIQSPNSGGGGSSTLPLATRFTRAGGPLPTRQLIVGQVRLAQGPVRPKTERNGSKG